MNEPQAEPQAERARLIAENDALRRSLAEARTQVGTMVRVNDEANEIFEEVVKQRDALRAELEKAHAAAAVAPAESAPAERAAPTPPEIGEGDLVRDVLGRLGVVERVDWDPAAFTPRRRAYVRRPLFASWERVEDLTLVPRDEMRARPTEPAPPFAVGDRVRTVDDLWTATSKGPREGSVTRVYREGKVWRVRAIFDGGGADDSPAVFFELISSVSDPELRERLASVLEELDRYRRATNLASQTLDAARRPAR